VTLGIIFFAVSQSRDLLFYGQVWCVRIAYGFIVTFAIYAIIKVYWLGGACSEILSANPSRNSAESNQPYLAQLEQGAYDVIRSRTFGYFVFLLGRREGYKKVVVPISLFLSLLFSLPSILRSVLLWRVLLRTRPFGYDWHKVMNIGLFNAVIGAFALGILVTLSVVLIIHFLELWKISERGSKGYAEQRDDDNELAAILIGPEAHSRWIQQQKTGF